MVRLNSHHPKTTTHFHQTHIYPINFAPFTAQVYASTQVARFSVETLGVLMKKTCVVCQCVLAACLILVLSTAAQAQVYKWVDENGKVHYSDKKPPDNAQQKVEVVDEAVLNDESNVLDSADDGVDPNRLQRDRERREQEREDKEQKRLASEADNFKNEHCVTREEPIRRGKAGGGTRVVGKEEVKRCLQAIPEELRPFLSDYIYEEGVQ